eukprot:CAMPEP_0185850830 /NCGR_PEP_ID=MMETSP1354-20130828/4815_1 /TAXON_ID=708628 /ORGANISM="Erythrolobus madagascarensis, Strain CCMP3276" /LENGTH=330 /DNA_ID=CAMNT_0028551555 /DNA_START=133 /DNA_END=1125 /DNA_ORIENTATION=-
MRDSKGRAFESETVVVKVNVSVDRSDHVKEELLLVPIMPVGVGITKKFWTPFVNEWANDTALKSNEKASAKIIAVDLLGTGEGWSSNAAPLSLDDWAGQIEELVKSEMRASSEQQTRPVILAQGASCSIAVRAAARLKREGVDLKALVLVGPPPSYFVDRQRPAWLENGVWNLLRGPIGLALWKSVFSKRSFIADFSQKNLFADSRNNMDSNWLDSLTAHASKSDTSRFAVFSFLSGFWQRDMRPDAKELHSVPVLLVFGDDVTPISSGSLRPTTQATRKADDFQKRASWYKAHLKNVVAVEIIAGGKNILPWENSSDVVRVVKKFLFNI